MSNIGKHFTITPLKKIEDERGKVLHMLREDSPVFRRFGEIYFSFSNKNIIKGWYQHKKNVLNFALIQGIVKLVIYKNEADNKNYHLDELILSQKNYSLISLEPFVWYSFKNIGHEISILANCTTLTHNPNEIEKMPINNKVIPYDWFSSKD